MANLFSTQILSETNKKVIIKLTGQLDANGTTNTVIQGRNFRGALAVDSNNRVLVSAGGVPRATYNYSVARIMYDVGIPNGYVTLNWEGANTGPIAVLWSTYDLNMQDNLGLITNNAISPNGNISISTTGSVANSSYTIILELHKNASNGNVDFITGLTSADFNSGIYAVKP